MAQSRPLQFAGSAPSLLCRAFLRSDSSFVGQGQLLSRRHVATFRKCVPMSKALNANPFLATRSVATKQFTHLTGNTLSASLKMRCDTSGAGYAIYWVKVKDYFVVAGDHVTEARKAALKAQGHRGSYAEASRGMKLPARGAGPVAMTYKYQKPFYIQDASRSDFLVRKDFVKKYDMASCCFIPFENGVLEYGTSNDTCTANWTGTPKCPLMPKNHIRKAFEAHGAKYVMFWAEKDPGYFSVIAHYVTPERVRALRTARGDDKTFCSESLAFKLPKDGDGYVAEAARTGVEVHLRHAAHEPRLQRRKVAEEFGVDAIHWVPVDGGVLEYGIPKNAKLTGNLLAAVMKMRCDTSGAAYALYWVEIDGEFVAANGYIADAAPDEGDARRKELLATSVAWRRPYLDRVANTGQDDYSPAESVAFIPVEGGVLEYGAKSGSSWGKAKPDCPDVPKAEMTHAFRNGAVFVIFWVRKGDHFVVGADFVIPERVEQLLNERDDDETFCSRSRHIKLPVVNGGYVATAAESGKSFKIADAAYDTHLKRQGLAVEFDIGEIHIVPCKHGVIEYGKPRHSVKPTSYVV